MTELKCSSCGVELLAGTNFCRRCGASINSSAADSSELPTAILGSIGDATTQRLEPRSTSGNPQGIALHHPAEPEPVNSPTAARPRRRNWATAIILSLIVAGIIGAAVAVKLRRPAVFNLAHSAGESNSSVIYPGAQVIVDLTNTDGSRTIQLQTSDQLDRVENWYQSNLDLDKTVRLTPTTVVMKGAKVSITLALASEHTNILIKQSP